GGSRSLAQDTRILESNGCRATLLLPRPRPVPALRSHAMGSEAADRTALRHHGRTWLIGARASEFTLMLAVLRKGNRLCTGINSAIRFHRPNDSRNTVSAPGSPRSGFS